MCHEKNDERGKYNLNVENLINVENLNLDKKKDFTLLS